ncbi:MAG TPA: CheR family methyltransferase [Steroidobacteraceae bacterium]|jgi:chemotaxis protein methyltransferase CheR|nr:CheR family methyltransferase [Steroidobacteraceae bacterium]
MAAEVLADSLWERLSRFIAQNTGLHFPPERSADLQRGLGAAAEEFGFADHVRCAEWVLSGALTRPQLHALASHLTVGETYFFRERRTFEALSNVILPELISRRRGREQRLRLWSAACCTGEEAYSLAILLQQLLPDWRQWNVTILATDINERFLQKAAAGIYGEWSFRDCAPLFKERHFTRTPDGRYQLAAQVRDWVTFAQLNLAEDGFPSLGTGTNAMDLILCRNLLLYFTPAHARKLVEKLCNALLDQGWLAVSPSECSQALFSRFATVNFPGAVLYCKDTLRQRSAPARPASLPEPAATFEPPPATAEPTVVARADPPRPEAPPVESPQEPASSAGLPRPLAAAEYAFSQGRYGEAVDALLPAGHEPRAFSLLARAYANQGKLTEALSWTARWIESDRVEPAAHYLHAMILQEKGERRQARRALQSAIYLRPDFALAHFALGNLARAESRAVEANKHFANALRSLRHRSHDEPLPDSDGMTVGRLVQTITALAGIPGRPQRAGGETA